ncbi:hypothetical protein A2982_01455 [candidate division WWE3 bacterium RIFCSPLOWO2_01_FULL_39_13]|uniref:Uncharacterized protein n=1 Tax=candidate division WWE3 bacterium RIFCSPLOWO2_01_FULL_39_13 TaxID=1802624 RepID=A0A1F4V4L8_UNCKA|nr:MAG: hypothetical protein A2982_01455 [candidate division WWE3 bacterium RIFCSPLOWO2_01_FULL_39_13]
MSKGEAYLRELREILLSKREAVSNLEFTLGNYDDVGSLIGAKIPTLTTEFCEIGIYNKKVYFTSIVHGDLFSKELFDSIKNIKSVQVYGFKNFKNTLYPGFSFKLIKEALKNEEYVQVQFDYDYKKIIPVDLYKKYRNLMELFLKNRVRVVNQIEVDLGE